MPKVNLTQFKAERLPPPTEQAVTYWDASLPGFGLRVSPRGKKVWVCQYRVRNGRTVNGKSAPLEVLETIAPMAVLPSIADARDRARGCRC